MALKDDVEATPKGGFPEDAYTVTSTGQDDTWRHELMARNNKLDEEHAFACTGDRLDSGAGQWVRLEKSNHTGGLQAFVA